MLSYARIIKRMLPNSWQRAIERLVIKRARKWDHIQWLASSEGPPSLYFLKRFRLPLHAYLALRLHRSYYSSRHLFVPPSPRVKARTIRAYARRLCIRSFVETGTHQGTTVAAVASAFDRCITIELSERFWREASQTLRPLSSVTCVHGDSGVELQRIVAAISDPTLFWLDAHSSGAGTIDSGVGPIFEELGTIFSSRLPHVVLIDDARGHQIEAIKSAVPASHEFAVKNDIIRITPKPTNEAIGLQAERLTV